MSTEGETVYYVAVLRKEPDSDWGVDFPDVPGCISAGATHQEALIAAKEALQGHLDVLHDLGERIPEPLTDPNAAIARYEPGEQTAVALIEAQPPAKTIRVNITIQDRLWARVGEMAKAHGTTRSGMIARLVREQ